MRHFIIAAAVLVALAIFARAADAGGGSGGTVEEWERVAVGRVYDGSGQAVEGLTLEVWAGAAGALEGQGLKAVVYGRPGVYVAVFLPFEVHGADSVGRAMDAAQAAYIAAYE